MDHVGKALVAHLLPYLGVNPLALQEGIKKATLHNNLRMERDALLGASLHGYLRAESHNRLGELTRFLDAK